MSANGGNIVFSVGLWVMVGASAMFAVNRISHLQHMAPPAVQKAEAAPAPGDNDPPRAVPSDGVELRADPAGHYRSIIEINGRGVRAMVDTGATIVALTYEDAQDAGIHLRDKDYTGRMLTANGMARFAPVMLEKVSIGNITIHNVEAAVAERGALNTNLLGMSFLRRMQRFEVSSGRMILQ